MSPLDKPTQTAPRARAPRREGQRRQLTVPPALWEAAEAFAAEKGTTPNDALIHLAHRGAAQLERERALTERAGAARDAILAGMEEMGREGFLSPEEALEAALTLRRGG